MTLETTEELEDRVRAVPQLAAFFGLTFAITWGLGALLIFAKPQLEAAIGPMGPINHHWLYYVAVWAPTISAVMLSLAFGGWGDVKALALRFVRPMRPDLDSDRRAYMTGSLCGQRICNAGARSGRRSRPARPGRRGAGAGIDHAGAGL